MCGIVGYLGSNGAYEILIQGLKRLEYRGYDSAGVALVTADGSLNVHKSRGKVSNLEQTAAAGCTAGSIGIAHTRWATHGEPNDINAHPHVSQSGDIALVHNGTIENYAVLKKVLEEHGYTFRSETDTEVLVQLVDYVRSTTPDCSLAEAVREALLQVEGAYAVAVVEKGDPDTLVVARKSSPLVIGVGDGETFIASDATPIIGYTDKVIYLKNNEMAVIRRGEPLSIFEIDSHTPSKISIKQLKLSLAQLEKGGYDTFMLKEIFEQPTTLRDCLRGLFPRHAFRSGAQQGQVSSGRAHHTGGMRHLVACGTHRQASHPGLLPDTGGGGICLRIPLRQSCA